MSFNLAVILSESARCAPDYPVAVFDGGQLTYRQLDQASDRVAANLPAAAAWVLLAHRGELADGLVLRSLVPVSVRGPRSWRGRRHHQLDLGGAGQPARRRGRSGLAACLIRQEMDQFKHTHQAVSAEVLTRMLGFAAPAWLAFGTRATFDVAGRSGREADLG